MPGAVTVRVHGEPVTIVQLPGGTPVGAGLCDAHPPGYVRVHRIAWGPRAPDLRRAAFRLALPRGRWFQARYDGPLAAGAPPPTDVVFALERAGGF